MLSKMTEDIVIHIENKAQAKKVVVESPLVEKAAEGIKSKGIEKRRKQNHGICKFQS